MNLPVYKVQQRPSMSSLLKKELDPEFSREGGTLLAGSGGARTVLMGALLGMITADGMSVIAAAGEGNTGNGELTLAEPAFTSAVKAGRYTVTFTDAASDAGDFLVEGPDGKAVGTGSVGQAFGKQIKFTIADGATDFVAGDQFFIDAFASDEDGIGKLVEWDPTGSDGREVAYGVCLRDATAAENVDGDILYARRLCLLYGGAIVWPEGVTDAQKARALAQLSDQHVLVRN